MENTLNNYSIALYPSAIRDLDNIYSYICNEILEPSVAKSQIDCIWNAIESLNSFPYAHQDRLVGRYANKGYKQLLVDNYIVIYKINEDIKTVYIVVIKYCGKNI